MVMQHCPQNFTGPVLSISKYSASETKLSPIENQFSQIQREVVVAKQQTIGKCCQNLMATNRSAKMSHETDPFFSSIFLIELFFYLTARPN